MDRATIILIVDHAVRWSNNILTEVLGKYLGDRKRRALSNAIAALSECTRMGDDDDYVG
jgi:hypothetical protein